MNIKRREAIRAPGSTMRSEIDAGAHVPATIRHDIAPEGRSMSVASGPRVRSNDRMPARPGIGANRPAADLICSVDFPDRDLARARVLKKDVVGKAVASEIAGSGSVHARPGIGANRPAADPLVAVHLPNRKLARARVLERISE